MSATNLPELGDLAVHPGAESGGFSNLPRKSRRFIGRGTAKPTCQTYALNIPELGDLVVHPGAESGALSDLLLELSHYEELQRQHLT